jgi:hypothetical protein
MRGAIRPPEYIFMAWCLVKHRDFTFTLRNLIRIHIGRMEDIRHKNSSLTIDLSEEEEEEEE